MSTSKIFLLVVITLFLNFLLIRDVRAAAAETEDFAFLNASAAQLAPYAKEGATAKRRTAERNAALALTKSASASQGCVSHVSETAQSAVTV